MRFEIVQERPDSIDSAELIAELEDYLVARYPPASRHGLSPEQLLNENVAFFVARVDGRPAGCCGIKFYGEDFAEIKRMYVRPGMRGKGLGAEMLNHLEQYSLRNGMKVIRLETGTRQPEAIVLYENHGYHRIPPFAHYIEDPLCLFYEKRTETTNSLALNH